MSATRAALEGQSHVRKVEIGSNRDFGLVFAVVFAIVAALPLKSGGEPHWWAAGTSGALLLLALCWAETLNPLNRLWFLIGLVLHRVVSPLVMGLLFFLTVTPVGLLMRATGKDTMRLKRNPAAVSYWIPRAPHSPAPEAMRRQF